MAKRKSVNSHPRGEPAVGSDQAALLLRGLRNQASQLVSSRPVSEAKESAWEASVEEILTQAFGISSPHIQRVLDVGKHDFTFGGGSEQLWEESRYKALLTRIEILDSLIQTLELQSSAAKPSLPHGTPPFESAPSTSVRKGYVFVAMPMNVDDHALVDVLDAIKDAATRCQLRAERIDEEESNERITDRILERIRQAEFVVADLTHSRPNVFYEAGYALGIGKIPIYIARDGEKLEFDLKDYPVIFFRNMKDLKDRLEKRLTSLRNTQRQAESVTRFVPAQATFNPIDPERRGDTFYFSGVGPYCTTCWENNGKKITLKEEALDFQEILGQKYICPVCKNHHKGEG